MTISATAPITTTSPQLMSNMARPGPFSTSMRAAYRRRDGSAELAFGGGRRRRYRRRLMLDGPDRLGRRLDRGYRRRRRRRLRGILVGHALLERFDALRDISHHF